MKSKPSFLLVCMLGSFFALLTGCESDTTTINGNEGSIAQSASSLNTQDTLVRPETSVVREQAKKMQQQQNDNNASYAAKTSFMCPKLLTKPIDDYRIKRRNEVLKNNYCEYYIYPKQGQSIEVVSNDDRIERLLVVPTTYNFANGAYIAKNKNRHTIRLIYNGATRKPADFRYDIEIIVK